MEDSFVKVDVISGQLCQRLQNYVNFELNLELERRWNLFSSTKSAKLSDHKYVMDDSFLMLLAIAVLHLHLVEKEKSCFLNPEKIVQRKRLLLQNYLPSTALLHK